MELTRLLNLGRSGDADANDAAAALIHAELKRIAAAELRRQAGRSTLNTTAVVHEAWEKLACYGGGPLADRQHYFRLAARAMRQVVIDHARAHWAEKRGGEAVHVELEAAHDVALKSAQEMLELDESLRRLATHDARAAEVVEAHVFGGLTFDEIAAALGISERTARSDWTCARAWLATELCDQGSPKAI